MPNDRVTVTLPSQMVRDIDRLEQNRSKFILEAVRRELKRRRRGDLHRSLRRPHPETNEMAELDIDIWASSLPQEDASDLVDPRAGKVVRWAPDRGWIEGAR